MRTRAQTKNAERRALWRAAATLGLEAGRGKASRRLPTVFFVTDPDRVPDPVSIVRSLPRGAGVIFRGFGRAGAEDTAAALAAVAKRRGLLLLIGADAAMAKRVGAGGVHLPERDVQSAPFVRRRHPRWIVTGAAHSAQALRRAGRAGLDAALLSTVFASRSSTASRPLGPVRLAIKLRGAGLPVIALGGVNGRTAKRLIGTGISGFAAVEALASTS